MSYLQKPFMQVHCYHDGSVAIKIGSGRGYWLNPTEKGMLSHALEKDGGLTTAFRVGEINAPHWYEGFRISYADDPSEEG